MLDENKKEILQKLADAFVSYTHKRFSRYPNDWEKHRIGMDGGAGGFLIDSCHKPEIMNYILKIICDGLLEQELTLEYQNAQTVSHMFEKLFKNEQGITNSIETLWNKDQVALTQLKKVSLSAVLVTKRIFEEESLLKPPHQAVLRVTSGYRGMTFVQELEEENQQNIAYGADASRSATQMSVDTDSSNAQRAGAPGGPSFGCF